MMKPSQSLWSVLRNAFIPKKIRKSVTLVMNEPHSCLQYFSIVTTPYYRRVLSDSTHDNLQTKSKNPATCCIHIGEDHAQSKVDISFRHSKVLNQTAPYSMHVSETWNSQDINTWVQKLISENYQNQLTRIHLERHAHGPDFISQRDVRDVMDARLHGLLVINPIANQSFFPRMRFTLWIGSRTPCPAASCSCPTGLWTSYGTKPHHVGRGDVEIARLAAIGHRAPLPLVETIAKKNRNCFLIAVLLTAMIFFRFTTVILNIPGRVIHRWKDFFWRPF